jgi:hypothetical protein
MKKLIMLGLAVLGLMTSCSNDELVTVSPANSSKEIAFSTHVDKVTRANADITNDNIDAFRVFGYTKTTKDDDRTKIFDSEVIQKGTDGWSYSNTQYWTIGNSYIFHAIEDGYCNEWTFKPSGEDDYKTGTIEFDNYPENSFAGAGDLIYAYKEITDAQRNGDDFNPVSLNFKHLLSRVKFRFEAVDGDDNDNPSNALYSIEDVRLVGAYKTAKIKVEGDKFNDATKWDNIQWTEYSTDDVIKDGLDFDNVMYSNSANQVKLNKCDYFYDESYYDLNDDQFYYFGYKGYGETDHCYVIPVVADDQKNYKVTFKVNLILATNGSTDDHTTGELIEATGYADLSKVAIDMQKGYSYVYTIKINAAKLKFTDPNQTHDPIEFDNITVEKWKIDDSTNDFYNSSQSTDATAE